MAAVRLDAREPGDLQGMSGFQDATLALKYNVLRREGGLGRFRAFVVGAAAAPLTDYTPDFYPLSIGSASKRLHARGTLSLDGGAGWFVEGSAGYTWRDNVELDRPSYFTNGQLFLTNVVAMPNVFDYTISAGWRRGLLKSAGVVQPTAHPRRRRHPPPGHAVRLEPHELFAPRRGRHVSAAHSTEAVGERLGRAHR